METGIFSADFLHIFLLSQFAGLIGCYLSYRRMQQDNWRQIHLHHTYLCLPMGLHFLLMGATFTASLCAVGAIRTLILSSAWGQAKKVKVIAVCLIIPVGGSLWTVNHWLDWLLLGTTILGVGAEGQSCMLRLRVVSLINASVWFFNSLFFGAYMGAFNCLSSITSNLKAMESQFDIRLPVIGRILRTAPKSA